MKKLLAIIFASLMLLGVVIIPYNNQSVASAQEISLPIGDETNRFVGDDEAPAIKTYYRATVYFKHVPTFNELATTISTDYRTSRYAYVTLPNCATSIPGYTFNGWSLYASSTIYKAGSSYRVDCLTATSAFGAPELVSQYYDRSTNTIYRYYHASVVLYGYFTPKTNACAVTCKYNGNGATTGFKKTITVNSTCNGAGNVEITIPATQVPQRAGYKFKGWLVNRRLVQPGESFTFNMNDYNYSAAGAGIYKNGKFVGTANIDAQWEEDTPTVCTFILEQYLIGADGNVPDKPCSTRSTKTSALSCTYPINTGRWYEKSSLTGKYYQAPTSITLTRSSYAETVVRVKLYKRAANASN